MFKSAVRTERALTEHYTWGKHNNLTSKTAAGGEKTGCGCGILGNQVYVQDPAGRQEKES